MTTIALNLCYGCLHYGGGRMCEAFSPKPIPDDIWENRFDHRYPHKDDGGTTFDVDPNGGDAVLEAWAEQNPELAN